MPISALCFLWLGDWLSQLDSVPSSVAVGESSLNWVGLHGLLCGLGGLGGVRVGVGELLVGVGVAAGVPWVAVGVDVDGAVDVAVVVTLLLVVGARDPSVSLDGIEVLFAVNVTIWCVPA